MSSHSMLFELWFWERLSTLGADFGFVVVDMPKNRLPSRVGEITFRADEFAVLVDLELDFRTVTVRVRRVIFPMILKNEIDGQQTAFKCSTLRSLLRTIRR